MKNLYQDLNILANCSWILEEILLSLGVKKNKMGEKRGNTGKLIFDFNPVAALEVQYNDGDERWFRVSAEQFRAFDGKRRITEPAEVIRGTHEVRMKTYEYDGPVYYWGTNKKAVKQNIGKLISSPLHEQALANSKKRGT